ncbi:uncharacterized protein N7496_003834 [Penicillium cataractarum]|uniref:Uncharacterized protein n=1 Tax=Penicillium cataractarum TaxID=2100454 RepID=A0A9W9SMU1_9EURO|nr:uncharacterized protein N7496_003834 [Penicillium cataractarum]KAJ5381406.1 hypothetical protein N7496_003834 [Penicillium cataractarum]
MSSPPIDPPSGGANDPDPMDTDVMGFPSLEEIDSAIFEDIDSTILEGFDPTNIDQMMADFTQALNAEMASAIATTNPMLPPPQHLASSQEALEGYLVQMQAYAGIPRDELQPTQASQLPQQARGISNFRIINGRLTAMAIPPATFDGYLAPMTDPTANQQNPGNSDDPGNDTQTGSNPNGSRTDGPTTDGSNFDGSSSDGSDSDGFIRVEDSDIEIDMGEDGN